MREKVFAPESARSSGDGMDVRSGRPVPGAVRVLSGLVALLVGLWLSYEFAMIAIDLGASERRTPWERLHGARRPLMTSVLYGVLAVAGFRAGVRKRPWSWWLACATPMPAWASAVVLGWF